MNMDQHPEPEAKNFTRRGFIGITGVAATAVAGSQTRPGQTTSSMSETERSMVLRMTRIMAVFPVPFPSMEGPGAALSRATAPRLVVAERNAHPVRIAYARTGAELLLADGLLESDAGTMLERVAQRFADGKDLRPLVSVAGLAVATLSKPLAPTGDGVARVWLETLSRLNKRGQLVRAAHRRGLK